MGIGLGLLKKSMKTFLFIGILVLMLPLTSGSGEKGGSAPETRSTKIFRYTASKFGIPILNASIKIDNGLQDQEKRFYQIEILVSSLDPTGFLFRMNNRFTSIVEAETYIPVRYVKEVNQEGLFVQNKNYLQTLTFEPGHGRVWVEKSGTKEKQEVVLPAETYDPLSMFARCYLKEELHPGKELRMSIYDGFKLRQMVFQSEKEKINSKRYGELDAVCLRSTTSFSSFGEKEGIIRIWYTADGKKTPIRMELDLPLGSVRFDLEGFEES